MLKSIHQCPYQEAVSYIWILFCWWKTQYFSRECNPFINIFYSKNVQGLIFYDKKLSFLFFISFMHAGQMVCHQALHSNSGILWSILIPEPSSWDITFYHASNYFLVCQSMRIYYLHSSGLHDHAWCLSNPGYLLSYTGSVSTPSGETPSSANLALFLAIQDNVLLK